MVHLVGMLLVVLFVAALVGRRRQGAPTESQVRIDAQGVGRSAGQLAESVRWDQLVQIDIVTTDAGPFAEDVFWLFTAQDGSGCALPGGAVGDALFARLGQLPEVDYGAVVQAMGSVENASFRVWSGLPGSASPAAQAAV